NWAEAPLRGGEWNLLELELDGDEGLIRLNVNAKQFTSFKFDPSVVYQGAWSPTIAQIGLEGKVGKLQEGHVDDIYIDSTLQRIAIGNAETLENLTHYEIQMATRW